MEKKIVVAIIGCGTIANLQHLPQMSTNNKIRIKYAVDIVLERAEAAKAKYGIEIACADYNIALADKEVDAVIVLTPNFMHYTISMDAMASGKHVFCEKPITVDYEKSVAMAEAAKAKKLILDIGVCNRFNRSVELIKKYVDRGDLGNIYHTYISFRSHRCIPGLGGDFTTKAVAGGGVLIDWGIHFVDLTLYVLGLPKAKTVSASGYNVLGKDISNYTFKNMWAGPPKPQGVCDVEDFITGFIRTDAASISFNGAWAQNLDKEEMFVDFLGDKAGIRLDYAAGFTLYTARDGVLVTEKPDFIIPNSYYTETDAFVESIKSGKHTHNNIEFVLESMRVLDAIYRSDKQGREVTL